ncbi:MAG: tyrosine-type recombinase/integrase, partial [Rikenellaceae bacterium]
MLLGGEKNIIERFISYIERERRCSPLTVAAYKRDLERFVGYLGMTEDSFCGDGISHTTIGEWIISRSDSNLSAGSINRELSTLRSLFKWMLSQSLIMRNPMDGIPSLKHSRKLPSFIPSSGMNRVNEDCCDKADVGDWLSMRDALIIRLIYSTGIRRSEAVGINIEDFSADMQSLKVRGKGNKERLIPIMPAIKVEILEYIAQLKSQNSCINHSFPLFLTKHFTRLTANMLYRIVRRGLGDSGVQGRRSPHVLRHTF